MSAAEFYIQNKLCLGFMVSDKKTVKDCIIYTYRLSVSRPLLTLGT